MANTEVWMEKAKISRDALEQSLPKQWLLKAHEMPTDDVRNVMDIPNTCGRLTAEELRMTAQNIEGLLEGYRSGTRTAEEVAAAFIKRAAIGQQLLNFATEFLTESAMLTARMLDDHYRQTGSLYGPLHGVPVSVKEHIAIAGSICNAGIVANTDDVAREDAHIVQLLKSAGAIIHVRTNQPQAIMQLDCDNNITGRTCNPYDRCLSPGGSSGGEGAAIAFRCSVLGVGTDIGGSIRLPAAFCNIYGFKPTALRNPGLGLAGIFEGQESVRGCVGPLAQCIDDLIRFEKAVLDQRPWEKETSLVPLSWKDVKPKARILTIGIMMDDGIVRPQPPVLRALQYAEQRLRSAGISVVTWEPYNHGEGWEIARQLYLADGGERLRNAIDATGEPMLHLTKHALGFAGPRALSILQNWDLNSRRDKYRVEYHAHMCAKGVDVILCPVYVSAGALHGEPKYWPYTAIWNILDQPALSIPSGLCVDKSIDIIDPQYVPRSEDDEREWLAYDPDILHGLPVSLQVVGKHHHDEELLQIAKMIEKIIHNVG